MFIINIDDFDTNHLYKCNTEVANILIEHGLPILARKHNVCYFTDTADLRAVLESEDL